MNDSWFMCNYGPIPISTNPVHFGRFRVLAVALHSSNEYVSNVNNDDNCILSAKI